MPPFKFQKHTRYEIYLLWLDARALCQRFAVPPAGAFVVDPDYNQDRRRRFLEGLGKLSEVERWDLIEGGALFNAASDVVALFRSKEPIAEGVLRGCVYGCERVLGAVATSQVHHDFYLFSTDPTPLDDEQDLLSIALSIDEELLNGETHFVDELARVAQVEKAVVRRILCRWMDDRVAYMPSHAIEDDREPFILENRAQKRFDNWSRYEESRMHRFDFVVEVERPFPKDPEKLVRGIGRELGLTFEEVDPASKGFVVSGWCKNTTSEKLEVLRAELTDRVRTTFEEERRHERDAVTPSTTVHNYSAQQVGAQGPGAIASHNTMTLVQHTTDVDAQVLLPDLATLREYLLKRGVTSADDAVEVAAVVDAEKAVQANDVGLLTGALKKLGAKTLDVVGTLGLTALKAWIATKLGGPPALPPGG